MGVAHSFASRDGSYHSWRVQSRLVMATMVKEKAMEAKMNAGSGERKRDSPAIGLGRMESRELRNFLGNQNKSSRGDETERAARRCTEQIVQSVAGVTQFHAMQGAIGSCTTPQTAWRTLEMTRPKSRIWY